MSNSTLLRDARRIRPAFLAATAAVVLACSGLSAAAQSDKGARHQSLSRQFRAEAARDAGRCIPANGAQIMGGFAGSGDRLDSVTGEICAR
jgi:hypothetical protein